MKGTGMLVENVNKTKGDQSLCGSSFLRPLRDTVSPGGGEVLPYNGYTGMCRSTGYVFAFPTLEQGIKITLLTLDRFISESQTKSGERFVIYASVLYLSTYISIVDIVWNRVPILQ